MTLESAAEADAEAEEAADAEAEEAAEAEAAEDFFTVVLCQ